MHAVRILPRQQCHVFNLILKETTLALLFRSLRVRSVATSAADPEREVLPGVPPNPKSELTIDGLHEVFGDDALRLHRFPCDAIFDTVGWMAPPAGSKTQAAKYIKQYRRPLVGSHMCANSNTVPRLGAPPSLVSFPETWGGISSFVPIGRRGLAAWRYAHESIALLHDVPQLPCHMTIDPSVACALLGSSQLSYVFDRAIGRSWAKLCSDGIARPADRNAFPHDDATPAPLAYHVLITAREATPKAQLERVAQCLGWEACLPPACVAHADDTETRNAAPIFTGGVGEIAISAEFICDLQLRNVERLLDDGLVHVHAPLQLCVEALMYMYLFQHHQDYFAGRLDLVLALDDGRCAELLVAAAERAFPGDDYGKDEWAHMYVYPILHAARVFLNSRDAARMSHHECDG